MHKLCTVCLGQVSMTQVTEVNLVEYVSCTNMSNIGIHMKKVIENVRSTLSLLCTNPLTLSTESLMKILLD